MSATNRSSNRGDALRDALGARDPRAEAQRLVAGRFDARVLEPSPPAVADEWFADDPTIPDGTGTPVVGPTPAADLTWSAWLVDYPELQAWAADRWLGGYHHLSPPPATLTETRLALHRLAVYVMSPARRRATGKIGLRWTLHGFGTPFYGDAEQVRVVGEWLVHQRGDQATAVPIGCLNEVAAVVLGDAPDLEWAADFDVPAPGDLNAGLPVDPAAALWLGDWYGFAYSVLEELRSEEESTDAGRVQLWAEHFDCSFECLPDPEGRRAGYGFSPGDSAFPEPYAYVAPWSFDRVPASDLWNATAFRGAVLPFRAFAGASDQRAAVLSFLRDRRALLAS